MGSMMKGDKDIVTISLKGDGPAGYITVTADSHGHVKGFPGIQMLIFRASMPESSM